MNRLHWTLPAVMLGLLTGGAHAQDIERALQLAQAELQRLPIFMAAEGVAEPWGEHGSGRVVKGAPYCAETDQESVQWLPDGSGGAPNRIVQRGGGSRLCRDGEGRTRQESGRTVYLRDPVSGEAWVLDTERKTAQRLGGPRLALHDTPAWREYGERMREWARAMAERVRIGREGDKDGAAPPLPPLPAPPMPAPQAAPMPPTAPHAPAGGPLPPVPPTPVVISRSERSEDGRRQVAVNVVRMTKDEAGRTEWSMAPPAVQWRALALAPRGPGAVTPLPAKDIDGVRANGEKTTWVIEAGKVGNDKPIQITREVWTSPELMVTLQSRDFDPRTGEVNYRLKNLRRGEPEAALMKVPADYTRLPRPGAGASGPTG